MKQGLSIIIPAYHEEENLSDLLPKLINVMQQNGYLYEILVVGIEGETDHTSELCQRLGVRYIIREGGETYGAAFRTGIKAAGEETIVVMDADGSHNPEDIPDLAEPIWADQYDIVIGSRYINGGGSHNNVILKAMSYAVNITYNLIFKLNVKDVSDSFRAYRASDVKKITLECDNFDVVEEILIKLKMNNNAIRIHEHPIFFDKRKAGKSKRKLIKFVFSYIFTICRLIKCTRK